MAQTMSGQAANLEGIIVETDGNHLLLRSQSGSEVNVVLVDTTTVQERKSNPFRGAKRYSRMGSGKGSPDQWVAVVKPGRVMFELAGVPEDLAKEAIRLAAHKLPIKCRFATREDIGIEG